VEGSIGDTAQNSLWGGGLRGGPGAGGRALWKVGAKSNRGKADRRRSFGGKGGFGGGGGGGGVWGGVRGKGEYLSVLVKGRLTLIQKKI